MRRARASRRHALVALLVVAGCRSHEPAPVGSKAAASASASTTARASAPDPSASAPRPRPRGPGCRVLAVKAPSPPPAGTPSIGAGFGGQAWLGIAQGVEVSMKHGETTREFRLVGPGLFLPCPESEEEVVVASGTVVTTPGPGSRAGAEVMLATPFGVVLYADAALELAVTHDKLTLRVKQGEATLNDTADENLHGEVHVEHVKPTSHGVTKGGKVNADELAKSCDAGREQGILPPPADRAARGAWASNMLEWHRRVRLRCARAAAAVAGLGKANDGRLEDLLNGRKSAARPAPSAETPLETDAGK